MDELCQCGMRRGSLVKSRMEEWWTQGQRALNNVWAQYLGGSSDAAYKAVVSASCIIAF